MGNPQITLVHLELSEKPAHQAHQEGVASQDHREILELRASKENPVEIVPLHVEFKKLLLQALLNWIQIIGAPDQLMNNILVIVFNFKIIKIY
jgi:hypothetical protein